MNNNNNNNANGNETGNNGNYAQGQGRPNQTITGADIPLALKARYFGSGVLVGVFASPLMKKALTKIQPRLDGLLDSLTGQAEGLVEKSSDLVAKAKEALRKDDAPHVHEAAEEKHEHSSNCTH